MFSKNRSRFSFSLLALFILVIMALSACTSGSQDNNSGSNPGNVPNTGGNGAAVNVTMTSYQFQTDQSSIPAGPVKFHVTNAEKGMTHEMVVLKTDLAGSKLPTDSEGKVDEEKLQSAGEVEVENGGTKDLSVTLAPGHYVLLCNEPGHYKSGMYKDITVE